jgi:hypothetical protein
MKRENEPALRKGRREEQQKGSELSCSHVVIVKRSQSAERGRKRTALINRDIQL